MKQILVTWALAFFPVALAWTANTKLSDEEINQLLSIYHSQMKPLDPHKKFELVQKIGGDENIPSKLKGLPPYLGKKLTVHSLLQLQNFKDDGPGKKKRPKSLAHKTKINPEALNELFFGLMVYEPRRMLEYLAGTKLFGRDAVLDKLGGKFAPEKAEFLSAINSHQLIRSQPPIEDREAKFKPLFEHYYQSIDACSDARCILSAIAEIVRAVRVANLMPSEKSNATTLLVLNQLLIENNMPLCVVESTVFDGRFCIDQMVEKIQKGMAAFLNLNTWALREFLRVYRGFESQNTSFYETQAGTEYEPFWQKKLREPGLKERLNRQIQEHLGRPENSIARNQMKPLEMAIYLGNIEQITDVIAAGHSPFVDTKGGLVLAIRLGNLEVVRYLIEYGRTEKIDGEVLKKALFSAVCVCNSKPALNALDQQDWLAVLQSILDLTPDFSTPWLQNEVDYLRTWAQKEPLFAQSRSEILKERVFNQERWSAKKKRRKGSL